MPGSGDDNRKIEGHMTFYLESKYQDSRSENRNPKMGCHTTSHLEGNIHGLENEFPYLLVYNRLPVI